MNKQKKILLILTPGFPSSEDDSTCLPLQQNLVLALKENNPGIHILVLSLQYPYFKKTYQWNGIAVKSFNGRNKRNFLKLLLRQKVEDTLKNLLKANEIIGLLSFWYGECAYIAKRLADKYKLRHYCWILGQDAKKENKYVKKVNAKNNELIALSDFLQDEFERNHYVRPEHVITPGINPKLFGATSEKSVDVLAAGSLIPLKQFDIFIEVISSLKEKMPCIKAGIIGNGPEKEKLLGLIQKEGLQANIILTGELPYKEVLKLMQQTKLFIHPSVYEGFPGVCQEALHAGAQVISFVRPMKNEIENWHYVNDKEEMITKAMKLLNSCEAVTKKLNGFTIEETASRILKLF